MNFKEYITKQEKIRNFTTLKSLKQIRVVCQNSRNVKWQMVGLESFIIMSLWQKNYLKKNEYCLVFDEDTKQLLGYIIKDKFGIPTRYNENELSYFNEWYQERV